MLAAMDARDSSGEAPDASEVDSEMLRDILLTGLADIRARQLAGMRMSDRDSILLKQLLEMLAAFPAFASAIEAAQSYQPAPDAAREGAAIATPEALRRLRAVMGGKS